jgi:hypothetical protein
MQFLGVICMKLFAAFGCCVFCVAAHAADVSGKWVTQTEVQGIAINESCVLVQSPDNKLSGICETSSGKFKLTGKVDGTSVNFSHPAAYQGEDCTVTFFGKLDDPETISGSLDLQPFNAGGAFAMKRETSK